jgi:PPOX class probable F420-dependent enzyme
VNKHELKEIAMGYQFNTMSQERLDEFLNEPRNAIVATIRKSGSPQLSPVWYLYENNKFYFPVLTDSLKYKNLKRDPRVSICVDGAYPDQRAVMVNGTADFIEDKREAELYLRICRRYYEAEEDNPQGSETFHTWGTVAVAVVTPHRILSQDYEDWE